MAIAYPLQSLLNLRLYREDAAKAEVKRIEAILRQAREELIKKRQDCEEYRVKIPPLTEAEYAKIIGVECTLNDIEKVKARVALIEQKLVDLELLATQTEEYVAECEKNVQIAREAVISARKEAAKIEVHQEIWTEIQKKEAERLEDLEMEEFSGIQEAE